MKIIKIRKSNGINNYYEPVIKNNDHIWLIHKNHEKNVVYDENDKGRNFSVCEGIYKYNIAADTLENVNVVHSISNYFVSINTKRIYYYNFTCEDEVFFVNLYYYDCNVNSENIVTRVNVSKYYNGTINKVSDIQYQVDVFELNNRCIGFLIGIRQDIYDKTGMEYAEENGFAMLIHDMELNCTYEVKDRYFSKDGFEEKQNFKIKDRDFLLLSSSYFGSFEKKSYIYQREHAKDARGVQDKLLLFSVDELVNEVKNSCTNLSYKTIQTVDEDGCLSLIHKSNNCIYYEIEQFGEEENKLVKYNLMEDTYKSWNIGKKYYPAKAVCDDKVLLYNVEKTELAILTTQDNKFEIKDLPASNVRSVSGVLDEKYIVCADYDYVSLEYNFTRVLDSDTGNLVSEFVGRPVIFKDEGLLVIY